MKSIYLFLVILFTLISCSSDNDNSNAEDVDNFYALTVGNSWVYKYYFEDFETNEFTDFSGVTDSVSIVSTELINNKTYYKFRNFRTNSESITYLDLVGEGEYYYFLRDSVGYLVNDSGSIKYWNNNWEERVMYPLNNDPEHAIFAQLSDNIVTVDIEAGNFNCLDMEYYLKNIITGEQYETASHFYYTVGIGNVYDKFGYLNGVTAYEKRLVEYDID